MDLVFPTQANGANENRGHAPRSPTWPQPTSRAGQSLRTQGPPSSAPSLAPRYEGKLSPKSGTYPRQHGNRGTPRSPLIWITQKKLSPSSANRLPKPLFPYKVEEVKFQNSLGKQSAGRHAHPPGDPWPGSRRCPSYPTLDRADRDETLHGHKPLAVIADRLTRGTDSSSSDTTIAGTGAIHRPL